MQIAEQLARKGELICRHNRWLKVFQDCIALIASYDFKIGKPDAKEVQDKFLDIYKSQIQGLDVSYCHERDTYEIKWKPLGAFATMPQEIEELKDKFKKIWVDLLDGANERMARADIHFKASDPEIYNVLKEAVNFVKELAKRLNAILEEAIKNLTLVTVINPINQLPTSLPATQAPPIPANTSRSLSEWAAIITACGTTIGLIITGIYTHHLNKRLDFVDKNQLISDFNSRLGRANKSIEKLYKIAPSSSTYRHQCKIMLEIIQIGEASSSKSQTALRWDILVYDLKRNCECSINANPAATAIQDIESKLDDDRIFTTNDFVSDLGQIVQFQKLNHLEANF